MLNFSTIEDKPQYYFQIKDLPEEDDLYKYTEFLCFSLKYGAMPNENQDEIMRLLEILSSHRNEQVRYTIARRLCFYSNISHKLAWKLANDVPHISRKIIAHSSVLTTEDLEEILNSQPDKVVMKYIAERKNLEPSIVNKLVNVNDYNSVIALLKNVTAKIENDTYIKLIVKYQHNREMMKLIHLRTDLCDSDVEEILSSIDEPIKRVLINTYKFHSIPNKNFSYVRILDLKEHNIFNSKQALEIKKRIDLLYRKNRLSFLLILRWLCKGDLFSFVYAISKLTDIPFLNIRTLLFEDFDNKRYISIFHSSKFPEEYIELLHQLLLIIRKSLLDDNLDEKNFAEEISKKLRKSPSIMKMKNIAYILSIIEN
jgi:hypothetical protein